MKTVYTHAFETPFGTVRTVATDSGLAAVRLPGEKIADFETFVRAHFPDHTVKRGGQINQQAEDELQAYFQGRLKRFTVPLDVTATAFQQEVLRRVSEIPYGGTATYGDIAWAIGKPRASRAVGMANARNAVPIIVPCHRVIGTSGLGGYGGGLEMKKRLLELEEAFADS